MHKEHRSAGSHLEQYARVFKAVEINSTFYRPHREATWKRWAESVPEDFLFAVKAPQTITHEAQLQDARSLLEEFHQQIAPLGEKLGPVLFQLPPRLRFDQTIAEKFLMQMRDIFSGEITLEPRHASWFTDDVDALLKEHRVARVAADPPKGSPVAGHPGGCQSLAYYRLHGSPRTYYSAYASDFLQNLAQTIPNRNTWVIFDNTALSYAYLNAIELKQLAIAQ